MQRSTLNLMVAFGICFIKWQVLMILKQHKNPYEFVSFCYMIKVSEITDETGKGEEKWYKRKTH